jgi:AcrR family transcriptional regulator
MNMNSRARASSVSKRARGAASVAERGAASARASGAARAAGASRAAAVGAVSARAADVNVRGRLRERFRIETRDAILSAAEGALAEHGARAKMEVIAAAAGIAVGTLYNYFDDRQELVDALLELRRGELIARLDAALESSGQLPFARQLEAFLGAGLRHFHEHRSFIALLVQDELSSGHGGRWSTLLALRARAERLIEGGIESGVLRSEDRATYPHLLIGLLKGLIETALETSEVELTSKRLEPAVRCFLRGAGA